MRLGSALCPISARKSIIVIGFLLMSFVLRKTSLAMTEENYPFQVQATIHEREVNEALHAGGEVRSALFHRSEEELAKIDSLLRDLEAIRNNVRAVRDWFSRADRKNDQIRLIHEHLKPLARAYLYLQVLDAEEMNLDVRTRTEFLVYLNQIKGEMTGALYVHGEQTSLFLGPFRRNRAVIDLFARVAFSSDEAVLSLLNHHEEFETVNRTYASVFADGKMIAYDEASHELALRYNRILKYKNMLEPCVLKIAQ